MFLCIPGSALHGILLLSLLLLQQAKYIEEVTGFSVGVFSGDKNISYNLQVWAQQSSHHQVFQRYKAACSQPGAAQPLWMTRTRSCL